MNASSTETFVVFLVSVACVTDAVRRVDLLQKFLEDFPEPGALCCGLRRACNPSRLRGT